MDGTSLNRSGKTTASTVARWAAGVTAGLCVLIITLSLVRPATTRERSVSIVFALGLLLNSGSIFATHERRKMVLVVCGALLVVAAVLLHMFRSF